MLNKTLLVVVLGQMLVKFEAPYKVYRRKYSHSQTFIYLLTLCLYLLLILEKYSRVTFRRRNIYIH